MTVLRGLINRNNNYLLHIYEIDTFTLVYTSVPMKNMLENVKLESTTHITPLNHYCIREKNMLFCIAEK